MKVNRCFLIVLRTPIHRVLVARYLRDKKLSKKSLNFKFNSLRAVKKNHCCSGPDCGLCSL